MRVVIADSDLRAGRKLAESVDRILPTADVLLYDDSHSALEGIASHRPDVVFVGPQVGATTGPELVAQVCRGSVDPPTVVGVVATPDADASVRYVDAGARLVVAAPVDDLSVRSALRQQAGGIPGS